MSQIQDILNKMVSIIINQRSKTFNSDDSISQFTYTGNIKSENDTEKLKTNPSIVIYGDDIKTFNDLYYELYKQLKVDKKQLSFDQFQKDTRDLFFFNPNEADLKKIVNEKYVKSEDFYYIAPIYGIKCKENIIDFENIAFVSLDYIGTYANEITNVSCKDLLLSHFNNVDKKEHMLYFVKKYRCYDANYTKEKFESDLDEMINVLRFLCIYKTERSYIDRVKNNSNKIFYIAISETQASSNFSIINMNDIPIVMDKTWFDYKYAKKIMEILCKNNKNDLEQRIIRSLIWAGRSIEEHYLDLSCAEIAFAFESIFKSDKTRLITQSIQDQIAESTALILNNNYDDIKRQIKELKEFYGLRSAIAHGGKQEGNIAIYNKNLTIFREVIIKLLENDTYLECDSLEDLKEVLDKKKYS